MSKVGMLDWGIGGLSVLKKLSAQQPHRDVIYFSDSGFTPYGKLSASDLKSRLENIFLFLKAEGATALIVACNAASTAIVNENSFKGLPLINVITPTVNYCQKLPAQNLGVIGGQRTIDSAIYKSGIENNSSVRVFQSVAQPLSALIEQGKINKSDVGSDLEQIMAPLLSENIESLVLACTHYPALTPVLKELYPSLELIDPADFALASLKAEKNNSAVPQYKYFTTGDSQQMRTAAQLAFQWTIPEVQKPGSVYSKIMTF